MQVQADSTSLKKDCNRNNYARRAKQQRYPQGGKEVKAENIKVRLARTTVKFQLKTVV